MATATSSSHIPILALPIVEALLEPLSAPHPARESGWIVDCTFGGGGHTALLLDALARAAAGGRPLHRVLAVDQDAEAIARGRERFKDEIADGRLELVHARFSEVAPILQARVCWGLLADLGFSSDQIDDAERGLSFLREGPLDMRMDPRRGISCTNYLSRVSAKDLADVLWKFGEERYSRRIAGYVTDKIRAEGAPQTTTRLAQWISDALPPPARHGKIHPATRSFQALRIFLNEELDELETLLSRVILEIKPPGRVAILSFHSLEDREVKRRFREPGFRPLTKKPVEPDEEELRANPRSRSAKLRVAERTPPGTEADE